jgi:hypothetical protein
MKLKNCEIRPVPGHAFVKLESLFSNTGSIIIPDVYQDATMCTGRIVDIAYTPNQQAKLGLEALKPGLRVIMLPESGREIIEGEDVKDFTLEYHVRGFENELIKRHTVLAILGDDVKLGTQEQEIPRCHFCGNAASGVAQGVILMNGQCPRCHKDKYGVYHAPTRRDANGNLQPNVDVKVSDADVERFSEMIVRPRRKSDPKYKPSQGQLIIKRT